MKNYAARKIALTDRSLRALKPAKDGARQTVWDSLMPGLAVRVSALGKRSFYAVKRRAGATQPTWALLGVYPVMTLGQAREAARLALTALMAGEHPKTLAEEKRRAAAAETAEAAKSTFAAVAAQFAKQYLPRIKSAKLYEGYLQRTDVVTAFGARPLADIKRKEIIALLDGIVARSGPATARQALSVLRKMFNWALSRDLVEANPATGINVADVIGKAEARDRLLSDAELAVIWPAIPAIGEPFSTIYKLLLLTGARLREIAEAKWENFDEPGEALLIPADRAKGGEAMLIPLPPSAVALLRATPRFSGSFIFSTTAGRAPVQTFSRAKRQIDVAIAASGATMPSWVQHDFRRCVRSGLARLGVPRVVAELCLGHKQKGIEEIYDRHSYFDEKRAALRSWEAHLLNVVAPPPAEGGKVVALRARG